MTSAAAGKAAIAPPKDIRFNFAALVGDVSCFLVGMAFLDTATALPAIVDKLGGTPAFLGGMLALRQAGYYLPPLFVAHRLRGRTRFQPFLVRVCLGGRIWLFGAAWVLYQFGLSHPRLALIVLAIAYTLSWIGDGAGGVPWTAIVGRAIPAQRRGALFATSQMLSAFGRLLVGVLVFLLLSGRVVSFPANISLMTLGCAVLLFLSWVFLALLREPPPLQEEALMAQEPDAGFVAYLRSLPPRLKARPDFGRLALAQVLASASAAGIPFVESYAHHQVNTSVSLPLLTDFGAGGLAGLFLIVQTLGLVALAPLWGRLTDRMGPRAALLGIFSVALLSPIAALLAGLLGPTARLPLFLLGYFAFGAIQDGWSVITNYLLEIVPPAEQPTYIALLSVASAPALLLPLIAGALATWLGPPGAFVFALLLLGTGCFVAYSLPNTRQPSMQGL